MKIYCALMSVCYVRL